MKPSRTSNSSSPSATSISRAAWLSLAVVLLAGCNNQTIDTKLDAGFKALFAPRKTPQQYMLVAVSSEDPDARRDAVVQISKSPLYGHEWAIKGFVAIALLESEPQTRCVAIRALARTGDPRAVETALKILNYTDYPPQEVWPPVALCRWDATIALADLLAADKVPAESRPQVYKALLVRLRDDPERHARIAAARGLAYCPDEETVKALIEGLRDSDFAVAHQCEESLVLLTGRTHDANALAWEEWLAANRETAFAHAGEVPESRQPPYHNGVEKSWYDTKQLILWLWPGSKQEQ